MSTETIPRARRLDDGSLEELFVAHVYGTERGRPRLVVYTDDPGEPLAPVETVALEHSLAVTRLDAVLAENGWKALDSWHLEVVGYDDLHLVAAVERVKAPEPAVTVTACELCGKPTAWSGLHRRAVHQGFGPFDHPAQP